MSDPATITVTPIFVADLLAEDGRMPLYVHVIDHPDARVLVDTGMTERHPAVDDLDPRIRPLSERDLDPAGIDIVVNTHLHFDHCGGTHLVQPRGVQDGREPVGDVHDLVARPACLDVAGPSDDAGVRRLPSPPAK